MTINMPNTNPNTLCIVKLSALAALLAVLSGCGHHPAKDSTAGQKYLGNWTIDAVYHDPGENGEDAPISAGGNLEIVRDPKSPNGFTFLPGKGFNGEPAWNNLELNYKPGDDEDIPAPLISELTSELCSADETAVARPDDENNDDRKGYIKADVQYDFVNLEGRGLEFLESNPVMFGEEEHIVHIFRILKIDAKQPSLLIFYCRTSHCNHRGAAHATQQE